MVRPSDIYDKPWATAAAQCGLTVKEWIKRSCVQSGWKVVGFHPPKEGEKFVALPGEHYDAIIGIYPTTPRLIIEKLNPTTTTCRRTRRS